MAWGWRCNLGCESWPDEVLYKQCPRCGSACTRFSNLNVIEKELAEVELKAVLQEKKEIRERLQKYAAFDKFYKERCELLGIPSEGPLRDADLAKIPTPR